MDSTDKNEKISLSGILTELFFLLIVLTFLFRDIRYFVLDLPMYSLFKDSFYFPYYWSAIKSIIWCIAAVAGLIIIIFEKIKDLRIEKKIKMGIGHKLFDHIYMFAFIFGCYLLVTELIIPYGQALYKDKDLEYEEIIIPIEKLRYSTNTKGIRSTKRYRLGNFKPNKWQYKQLEKVKKQWGDEIDLRIYYMPNTEIILKWDIINQNDNELPNLTSTDFDLKNIKVLDRYFYTDKQIYYNYRPVSKHPVNYTEMTTRKSGKNIYDDENNLTVKPENPDDANLAFVNFNKLTLIPGTEFLTDETYLFYKNNFIGKVNYKSIKVIAENIIEEKTHYFCKNRCIEKKRLKTHL